MQCHHVDVSRYHALWKPKRNETAAVPRSEEPRPHLLITNNGAKMKAAMPQSWDQQDAGVKPTRLYLVGFTA